VVAKIKGQPDSDAKKTRAIDNTVNPMWNETLTFTVDSLDSILEIVVRDKDKSIADDKLASVEKPLKDCVVGEQNDFLRVRLNPLWKKAKKGGFLSFAIRLLTKGASDKGFCRFDWGSLNSSYSSAFEGYDTEHGCHGIGDPTSDELQYGEAYHVHKIVVGEKKMEKKVLLNLVGKVLSVTGVAAPSFLVEVFSLKHAHLKEDAKPESKSKVTDETKVYPSTLSR
jgi:hypothetical protein